MINIINWVLAIVSLIATWLNVKKLILCFYIWLVTNFVYVVLDIFIYKNVPRALLTFIQFILCFEGIREWRKA
jgi:hypothetical protein